MNKLEDVPGVCKLLDYGVTTDAACLVMPKYQGSMRDWLLQQPQVADSSMERVHLMLFQHATNIVKVGFDVCKICSSPSACIMYSCVLCQHFI